MNTYDEESKYVQTILKMLSLIILIGYIIVNSVTMQCIKNKSSAFLYVHSLYSIQNTFSSYADICLCTILSLDLDTGLGLIKECEHKVKLQKEVYLRWQVNWTLSVRNGIMMAMHNTQSKVRWQYTVSEDRNIVLEQ